MVLRELSEHVPPSEVGGDDPRSLARMATRAEMRQPGTIERSFGGAGGPGLGSMFLATLAGAFVGSAIADAFFESDAASESGSQTADAGESGDAADGSGDDMGGGDFGGDAGDFGGDFGGGDFGI